MTVLTIMLLTLTGLTPALARPVQRIVADPMLPIAGLAVLLLGAAAATAAASEQAPTGWLSAATLVVGIAAATGAGNPVVRGVFRLVRREFLPRRTPADLSPEQPPGASTAEPAAQRPQQPETVLRGGAWIGYLERVAVTATLLAGWPEGIALVLGVKGVGRYAELRESNAPEAFIIGTLASLLWAAAVAGTVELLRG